MNVTLLVGLGVFTVVSLLAAITGHVKPVALVCLVGLALFSGFGFLASFEPGAGHIYFRIGYAIFGVACVACGIRLLTNRSAGR